MTSFVRSLSAALVAALLFAAPAAADDPTPLRARLDTDSLLAFVGEPLRVRFALGNPSDAPAVVQASEAGRADAKAPDPDAKAPVTLSDAVIFDDRNSQGVFVSRGGRDRLDLAVHTVERDGPADLVLGARTTLVREIDLARHYPALKTPGTYEILWRPMGGAVTSNALRVRVVPRREVVLRTDAGDVVLELLYDKAPETCLQFVKLAESGHYDGLVFHRTAPGVLVQGGGLDRDFRVRATGSIAAEFNDAPHDAGTVSMARRLDPEESADRPPRKEFADSAAGQFFVCLTRVADYDRRFTVFARVKQGLDAVRRISEVSADPKTGRPRAPVAIRRAVVRSPGGGADEKP